MGIIEKVLEEGTLFYKGYAIEHSSCFCGECQSFHVYKIMDNIQKKRNQTILERRLKVQIEKEDYKEYYRLLKNNFIKGFFTLEDVIEYIKTEKHILMEN